MHRSGLPPTDMALQCHPYTPCACHSCQAVYPVLPLSSFNAPPPYPLIYPSPDIPFPTPHMGLHSSLPIVPGLSHPRPLYQTNNYSLLPEVSTVAPSWSYRPAPEVSTVAPSWSYRPTPRVPPSTLPATRVSSSSSSYSCSSGVSELGETSSPSRTELLERRSTISTIAEMAEEAGSSSSALQEKADMKTAQELADLEKLSAQYEPDVTGPLVGELQSSKILEAEYADADPVYVRKTAALSPTYTNYRTIKGDGNCGWRALAFGWFELLLRTGDEKRIEEEHNRIEALCAMMDSVGMADYLYEDFVIETKNLLKTIGKSPVVDDPYNDKVLVKAFNEDEISNSIITHLKLLTSAYMKCHPDAYAPFLIDHPTIDDYCGAQIEPYGVQIDHLGIKALIDVLFFPANLSVEISYLDRSDSDEVNVHTFEPDDGLKPNREGQIESPLRLLYRPGHYDLIYKNRDLAPPSLPTSPAISSKAPLGLGSVRVSMMLGQEYTQNPLPYYSLIPGIANSPHDICGHCFPPLRAYRNHDGSQSTLQAIKKESEAETDPPLQTKMFKNSHYNTRHFQNDHFQPEMWGPDQIENRRPQGSKRAFWKNFKH
ncbi:hypothetical protein TWF173_004214 [Orbilia oligospora]|nr:hypothetical protein TWF173_004214 [Orbilia oligospora]